MEIFAQRITALRKERKLTQTDVAKMLGVTQTNVYKYEKGLTDPPFKTVLWYADYFGVSTDYLFGRTNEKGSEVKDNKAIVPSEIKTYEQLKEVIRSVIEEEKAKR